MLRKYSITRVLMLSLLLSAAGAITLAIFLFHRANPIAVPITVANAGSDCPLAIANTTFIKSYRLLVFTKINGAWPTKDGGYIISGTTDPNIMFIPPDGFVAKLDQQGSVKWIKFLKTKNAAGAGNPLGEEDVQSILELKDGGYLMVSKVWGFIKAAEWKLDDTELNKILFTKLDKNGKTIWSKSFTGFVEDAKNSLLETADKGFLFYASITDLTPNKRGEDSEVYYDLPFSSLKVFKFDVKGNLQWSKNVSNFIARESDSFLTQTVDGGYALAGNLAQPNPEKDSPYNFDIYPGLAKFDKNFNFEWAKSFEGIPLEMAAAIPQPDGTYKIGSQKMRQGAIVTRGLARTKDNGYLVLGNLSMASSLMTDSLDLNSGQPHSYLVGFKFNSIGDLEWVKRVTLSFNMYSGPMTDYSLITTKDNNLMIAGSILWADEDYETKSQAVASQRDWYVKKYGEIEMLKESSQKSKQSQQDWQKVQTAIDAATTGVRSGVLMMKTDQELNPGWIKIAKPQRAITNYVLKATTDNGTIVAGEYETNVVKSVMFGSKIYYKDGFLMKLDASGNVKGDTWLANYDKNVITEIMTPYAATNDLTVAVTPYPIVLTNRQPEFSLYKKTKTTVLAAFKSSKNTACPILLKISANSNPLQNSTSTSNVERTWPQINYEKAVPVEPASGKSQVIHNELLPILNQLYNNQVKLTDNMSGMMLDYIFNRIVTADDKAEIKKYLEGLDYKTQDETEYQLTMYKVGYFLNLTFSLNNTNKGFLEITY
ncbi:MAG: hypothetical protein Q8N57_03495 [bacterium]|nr:hypothetical protein [bacterium]